MGIILLKFEVKIRSNPSCTAQPRSDFIFTSHIKTVFEIINNAPNKANLKEKMKIL